MEIISCDGWWKHLEGGKVGNLGVVVSRVIGRDGWGLKSWNDVRWKLLELWTVVTLGRMDVYSGVGLCLRYN